MKLKYLILVLTLGVALVGCTPDNESDPKPIFVDGVNVENLLGTWDWVSTEYDGVTYTECSAFDDNQETIDLIHNRIIESFIFKTGTLHWDSSDALGDFYNICEDHTQKYEIRINENNETISYYSPIGIDDLVYTFKVVAYDFTSSPMTASIKMTHSDFSTSLVNATHNVEKY